MRFVQFFHLSTGYVPGTIPPQFDPAHVKPIPACGSDGVLPLDGRWGARRVRGAIAGHLQRHPGKFTAYQIMAGRSFSDAQPAGCLWPVSNPGDLRRKVAA